MIFDEKQLLEYAFQKLKSEQQDTLRLAALALSRLAASLHNNNNQLFIENLRKFSDFN